ncbi:LysM domain-containing protein [Arthrobacter alpinus]|uniref:LysM domain-containing protein n=1 Tax=Arthrobacter alpinus TaxID=656366 RepID=A0A1H5JTF9_9MICC|nr:LysM peptidoglycan-binding domain-containing protein [Arthrobacter alpinus]SEE55839.1 LysM domain-containing protein [Arthrobacter alpinus]
MNAMVISAPPLSTTGISLTRRGRLVLLGIPAILTTAVMVFAALAIVLGSIASPAQASVEHVAVDMAEYAATVTVLQGDSLWSIAAASNPKRDVRDVVSEIVALNELGSGVVHAGQRLFVPLPK